jgi:ketosteroid isomerase-like protein
MSRLLLLTLLCAGLVCAAPNDEITKIEKDWSAAVAALDYAALDRILDPQLIYAHSTGVVETKDEYLKKMKSGDQKYDAIAHQSLTVKVYGNSAVAHSKVRMTGKTKGVPFDNQLMMMHVWVRQGKDWKLVAHQTTRLP